MIRISIHCDYCGKTLTVRVSNEDDWNLSKGTIFREWKSIDGKQHCCPRCLKKLRIE